MFMLTQNGRNTTVVQSSVLEKTQQNLIKIMFMSAQDGQNITVDESRYLSKSGDL